MLDLNQIKPTMKILEIANQALSRVDCYTIALLMKDLKQLETLRLVQVTFDDEKLKILLQGIRSCTSLQYIDLSKNLLSDEAVNILANWLKTNRTIRTLDLSGNHITHNSLRALFEVLDENNILKEVNLLGNPIDNIQANEVVKELTTNEKYNTFRHLNAASLTWFNLNNNAFANVTYQSSRISAVEDNSYYQMPIRISMPYPLHLQRFSPFSDIASKQISAFLKNLQSCETLLDLEINHGIDKTNAKLLQTLLLEKKSIRSLTFLDNEQTEKFTALEALPKVLSEDIQLSKIKLDRAKYKITSLADSTSSDFTVNDKLCQNESFIKCLKCNKLTDITIACGNLTDEDLETLAENLKSNTLNSLNFEAKEFFRGVESSLSIKCLADILKNNPNIIKLNLFQSDIAADSLYSNTRGIIVENDVDLTPLIEAFEQNTSLRKLKLALVISDDQAELAKRLLESIASISTLSECSLHLELLPPDSRLEKFSPEEIKRNNGILISNPNFLAPIFTNTNLQSIALEFLPYPSINIAPVLELCKNQTNIVSLSVIYGGISFLLYMGAGILKSLEIKAVREIVQTNPKLQTLKLFGMCSYYEEMHEFLRTLVNTNTLKDLTLLSCLTSYLRDPRPENNENIPSNRDETFWRDKDTQLTQVLIKNNKSLRKINLGIFPKSEWIASFAENFSLEEITIPLAEKYCLELGPTLIKALQKNTTMQKLSLQEWAIDTNIATAIADLLSVNTSIKDLDLSYTKLDNACLQIVAKGLKQNSSLLSLNLANNKISDEGVEALIAALATNYTLNELNVSNNVVNDKICQLLLDWFACRSFPHSFVYDKSAKGFKLVNNKTFLASNLSESSTFNIDNNNRNNKSRFFNRPDTVSADSSLEVEFIRAAQVGVIEDLKELLVKGVDIDTKDQGYTRATALHWASASGNVLVVKFLLEAGANPTIKDNDGLTAEKWAEVNSNYSVVQLIQDYNSAHFGLK